MQWPCGGPVPGMHVRQRRKEWNLCRLDRRAKARLISLPLPGVLSYLGRTCFAPVFPVQEEEAEASVLPAIGDSRSGILQPYYGAV